MIAACFEVKLLSRLFEICLESKIRELRALIGGASFRSVGFETSTTILDPLSKFSNVDLVYM